MKHQAQTRCSARLCSEQRRRLGRTTRDQVRYPTAKSASKGWKIYVSMHGALKHAGRGARRGDGMPDAGAAACESSSCFGCRRQVGDGLGRGGGAHREDATRACDSVCPVCLQARAMPPLCIIACQQVVPRRRDMFGPRWRGPATAFLFLPILLSLFRPFVLDWIGVSSM